MPQAEEPNSTPASSAPLSPVDVYNERTLPARRCLRKAFGSRNLSAERRDADSSAGISPRSPPHAAQDVRCGHRRRPERGASAPPDLTAPRTGGVARGRSQLPARLPAWRQLSPARLEKTNEPPAPRSSTSTTTPTTPPETPCGRRPRPASAPPHLLPPPPPGDSPSPAPLPAQTRRKLAAHRLWQDSYVDHSRKFVSEQRSEIFHEASELHAAAGSPSAHEFRARRRAPPPARSPLSSARCPPDRAGRPADRAALVLPTTAPHAPAEPAPRGKRGGVRAAEVPAFSWVQPGPGAAEGVRKRARARSPHLWELLRACLL